MNIVIEYPWWFVLFCITAGLLYSGVLYYKNNKLNELPNWLVKTLFIVRFTVVTLIGFLLLSPLLNIIDREVEKPIVIIAQDNSASIVIGKDSSFYRNQFKKKLQTLTNELSDKYEVKWYSFGDNVNALSSLDSLKFNEKQTSISSFFDEIETRYSNRNLGAVILATDGLYNKGSNPVYASEKIKSPVYSIALGDTTVKKDLVLLDVEHNRLAYLGNEFPLQIVVSAKKLKNATTTLTIQKGKNTLFTQKITITNDAFTTTIPVYLEAKNVGLQHYKIKLSALPGEMTLSNNERDVFIEVLDSRQKVLIVSNAPHPDVAAIKESLEANQNYEVESFIADKFNKSLKNYNLIILHGLPNRDNPATKIINEIKKSNIPLWIISGANTILNNDLSVKSTIQKTNECEALPDQNFSLFTVSEELRHSFNYFPAVVCPYGTFTTLNGSNTLLYQRIGMVDTKMPLMTFNTIEENKTALFYGEGIWRWRLQDFAAHGNHNVFDELISKTVQYLAVKVDKSFFKVSSSSSFYENEHILFKAELYNESYELMNEPEINIVIKNAADKKYNFTFSKTFNAYRLDAGMLPVGEYEYESNAKLGNKLYKQHGSFHIMPLNVESLNTVADHQLLYHIAKTHGGELFFPDELDKLFDKINSRDDIKSVSYTHNTLSELIHLKWIFFLILLLLTAEWFIRKWNGLY
jgi:hypothetical protein